MADKPQVAKPAARTTTEQQTRTSTTDAQKAGATGDDRPKSPDNLEQKEATGSADGHNGSPEAK